jgi:putative ABC transport system permease protein
MHGWLQKFDYRIGISWYLFVAAALLALVIAFATVSFQAIRAARANPVRSLRMD